MVQEGRGAEGPTEPGREGASQPSRNAASFRWPGPGELRPNTSDGAWTPRVPAYPFPGDGPRRRGEEGGTGKRAPGGPRAEGGAFSSSGCADPRLGAPPAQLLPSKPSEPRVHERPAQAAGGSKGPAELNRLPTSLP